MIASTCQFSVPLFGFGLIYLVFVVGAVLMPGKPADHKAAHRSDLIEVRNKAVTKHWTAPFYLLALPFLALLSFAAVMPWFAGVVGLGVMIIPQVVCR
jgi:hypothetical protein